MGDWHYIFQYVARNPMRGLGIGAVPVADDAVAAAFSIVGKPIRLIADKNYRDHIISLKFISRTLAFGHE
jgi:hypothetical protein